MKNDKNDERDVLTYHKYQANSGGEYYHPEAGSFALAKTLSKNNIKRSSHWYSCREEFDDVFTGRAKSFFFYDSKKGNNITRFIKEVEKRLKVEPRSNILGFKNLSNVTSIEFSKWWVANGMRRQFLTVLLRCGVNYKNNFNNALYSTSYTKETEEAVKRFFKGFIDYKGKTGQWRGGNGWVGHFSENDCQDFCDGDCQGCLDNGDYDQSCTCYEENIAKMKKPSAKKGV